MEIVTKVYKEENHNRLVKTKRSGGTTVEVEPKSGYKIGRACYARQDAVYIQEPESDDYIIVDRDGLLSLLSKVTVVNGVISDVCSIVWKGSQLTIEPVTSAEYIDAQLKHDLMTQQMSNTFKVKDLEVLDVVSVVRFKKETVDYVYCGEYNVLIGTCMKTFSMGLYRHKIYGESCKRYVFYKINENGTCDILFLSSFPKVVEKKGKTPLFVSESSLVNKLNNLLIKRLIPLSVDANFIPIFKEFEVDYPIDVRLEWTANKNIGYKYPLYVHPTGGFQFMSNKYIENINQDLCQYEITMERYY